MGVWEYGSGGVSVFRKFGVHLSIILMQLYTDSLTSYKRLDTVPVKVGDLILEGSEVIQQQTGSTIDEKK